MHGCGIVTLQYSVLLNPPCSYARGSVALLGWCRLHGLFFELVLFPMLLDDVHQPHQPLPAGYPYQ